MGIGDEIKQAAEVDTDIVRVRRQRDNLANQNARLTIQMEELERALSVVDQVDGLSIQPPTWLAPAKPKPSAATLVVMLSDTHFDEVVNPEEMEFLNAYNRQIAVMRLEKWTQNVIKLARHYLQGVKYDGIVIILGGDIFSGDIHEELALSNEDSMIGSLLFWSEQVAAAIQMLTDEFKKCHVVSVVGNHGRTTRKPRMKGRVKTNFDWLIAKMIERHFAKDKRVTFTIPESADALIQIYDHGHLITHGDQVTGGGGIAGAFMPLMRMRAKKEARYLQTGKSFRTMWCGHWHQYISTPSLIVNSTMKGFDEYALLQGYNFEQPQQALAIVTPERNITIQAPVFFADRKKEGW